MYIQEAQNKYSLGHEQKKKRPYLIIYESSLGYKLGFPLTTKNKINKEYPSHKNYALSNESEIMLDQLQIIHNSCVSSNKKEFSQDKFMELIKFFTKQIINNKQDKHNRNNLHFCDIIQFEKNINLLQNINKFLVISSNRFHVSQMCLVLPLESFDVSLMHCIDYNARKFKIIDKLAYEKIHIDELNTKIIEFFANNSNVLT